VWADLSGSNQLLARYVYGDGADQILARVVSAGQPNAGVSWYLTDAEGSVRDQTNASGVVQDHLDYDGFGNVTESNKAFGDRYKYTWAEYDHNTGLQRNGERYYNPATGTWMSQDPLGFAAGDPNLTRYVGNDPPNVTDPSGLQGGPDAGVMDAESSRINPLLPGRQRGMVGQWDVNLKHLTEEKARELMQMGVAEKFPGLQGSCALVLTVKDLDRKFVLKLATTPQTPMSPAFPGGLPTYKASLGYYQVVGAAPLDYPSRTLAEAKVLDQAAVGYWGSAALTGTLMLHMVPGGAVADNVVEGNKLAAQGRQKEAQGHYREAVVSGAADLATLGMASEYKLVVTMSMIGQGGVIAYRGWEVITTNDAQTRVSASGEIVLRVVLLRGGAKQLKAIALGKTIDPHLDSNLLMAAADPNNVNHHAAVKFLKDNQAAGLSASLTAFREFQAKTVPGALTFKELERAYGIKLVRGIPQGEIKALGARFQAAFPPGGPRLFEEDARIAAEAFLRGEKLGTADMKFFKRAWDLGLNVEFVGSDPKAIAEAANYMKNFKPGRVPIPIP
jgi:RHS repeat-associated protein